MKAASAEAAWSILYCLTKAEKDTCVATLQNSSTAALVEKAAVATAALVECMVIALNRVLHTLLICTV